MFHVDEFRSKGDRPGFLGYFQNNGEGPCSLNFENETTKGRFLPYERNRLPSGRFSPNTFKFQRETQDEIANFTNEPNVHFPGNSKSDSQVFRYFPESRNSFREVDAHSSCGSSVSYVTVDRYPEREDPSFAQCDPNFRLNSQGPNSPMRHYKLHNTNLDENKRPFINRIPQATCKSYFPTAMNSDLNRNRVTHDRGSVDAENTHPEQNGISFHSTERFQKQGGNQNIHTPGCTYRGNEFKEQTGNYNFPYSSTSDQRQMFNSEFQSGQNAPVHYTLGPQSRYVDQLHARPVRNCTNYGMTEMRPQIRKLKNPDTYDGQNVEWNDYICHFEQVSQWNRWSENEMAAQLVMSLRGSAQRVLSELNPTELSNYFYLKQSLTKRFCPPEREIAYRCEFRNRKRKEKESVADYGYALRRLSSLAFPDLPVYARESMLIDQYISGLGNQELRRHVQFAHAQSFDKAISLALEFEAFEGVQFGSRKPINDDTLQVRGVSHTAENADETVRELKATVENLSRSIKNLTANREASNTEKKKKTINCYSCGQEGHISRNCPKRVSSREEQMSVNQASNMESDQPLNRNGLSRRPNARSNRK